MITPMLRVISQTTPWPRPQITAANLTKIGLGATLLTKAYGLSFADCLICHAVSTEENVYDSYYAMECKDVCQYISQHEI